MHPYISERLNEAHRQDLLSEAACQRVDRSPRRAVVGKSGMSGLVAIVQAGLSGFIVVSRQVGRRLSFIGRVAERETWQP